MTSDRLRESEGFSGGGSLRREVVSAATAAGGVAAVAGVLAVAGWAWAAMSTSCAVVADMAALATHCIVLVVAGVEFAARRGRGELQLQQRWLVTGRAGPGTGSSCSGASPTDRQTDRQVPRYLPWPGGQVLS